MAQNVFLHADLDAFFASVEQLDYPEYRGKPVIVGGQPDDRRSVVSTCSYEARAFGVHSAMPMAKAVQLCPQAVFVRGRMSRYQEKSQEVMDIFSRYSPDIQQLSIDEAFIDVTGTERLFGPVEKVTKKLKDEVRRETGLTVSVGAASNKYIAKIASGMSKPDGLFIVQPGDEEKFMLSLPLSKLWGAGEKTRQRLNQAGFFTIRDIHASSLNALRGIFGEHTAHFLYYAVRGCEVETFSEETKSKSISAEHTYSFDLYDRYAIETGLMELSSNVMFRLLREGWTTKTVHVKIRYEDFTTVSVQETFQRPVTSSDDLAERAAALFHRKYDGKRGIRLLGVGAANLERGADAQGELFDFGDEKKRRIEKAVIEIETKNPAVKIGKARFLNTIIFCAAAALFTAFPLTRTVAQDAGTADTTVHQSATENTAETPSETEDIRSASNTAVTAVQPVPADQAAEAVRADQPGMQAAETERTVPAQSGSASAFPYALLPVLPSLKPESPSSLFSYSADDESVEFFADGFWETKTGAGASASFTGSSSPSFSADSPYIDQNVDLSLWFFLNNAFYFEAAFADDFEKNSIAAGYYGTGVVKHVRIGNSGIFFPNDSYTSPGIGGGENIGPGISAHFEGKKWAADAAVRYDVLESHEKEYAGSSEITSETYLASSWERGRRFALPDTASAKLISTVYVYDEDGPITDTSGRTYRKLESSEYIVLSAQCVIITAKAHTGAVCASFYSSSSGETERNTLISKLGTYGEPGAETGEADAGTGFLGEIQSFFGSSSTAAVPDTASFSYGGEDGTSGYFTEIYPQSSPAAKEWAVILQNPPYFSPFAVASFYKLGQTEPETAEIVSSSTDIQSAKYSAAVELDSASFVSDDFLSAQHYYARVYDVNSEESGYQHASVRFPFADTMSSLYLCGNSLSGGFDTVIKTKTYSSTEYYEIGTDAMPGTVQVWRNGILDTSAQYSQKTGRVTFASKPSSSEKIRITWQETDTLGSRGAVSSAAGFKYSFAEKTFADAVISSYWSWTPDAKFSTSESLSPGSISFTAGFSHTSSNFSMKSVFDLTADVSDTSGMIRVLGMNDDDSSTVYLDSGCAQSLSAHITPSLNSRVSDSAAAQEIFPALAEENRIEPLLLETKRDGDVSGYTADASWSFASSDPAYSWTSFNIDFGGASSVLSSASRADIQIRFTEEAADDADFDIYLQLGIDSGSDAAYENAESVPTWRVSRSASQTLPASDVASPLYTAPAGIEKTDWQTVTVSLTDLDRARLQYSSHARIIIVKNAAAGGADITGGIRIGPYRIREAAFEVQAPSALRASSFTQSDNSVFSADTSVSEPAALFNSTGTNSAQHFSWITVPGAAEESVSFIRYIPEISVDSVSNFSFFLYIPSSSAEENAVLHDMTVTLDRPSENGTAETALTIFLPAKLLAQHQGSWIRVTANLITSAVTIGETDVSSLSLPDDERAVCTAVNNTSPVRVSFTFSPGAAAAVSIDACAYTYIVDELYFSGIEPSLSAGNTTELSWKKSGTIVSAGKYNLFSDASASASNTASFGLNSGIFTSQGSAQAGISTLLARLEMKAAYSSSYDTNDSSSASFTPVSAGHIITSPAAGKTSLGVFNYLSFAENFTASFDADYAQKKTSVKISVPSAVPLTLSADSDASLTNRKASQKAAAKLTAQIKGKKASYTLTAAAEASQSLSQKDILETASLSYADIYTEISEVQFSAGDSASQLRKTDWSVSQSFSVPSIKLEPVLKASGTAHYTADTSDELKTKTALTLSIPFTAGKQRFTLSAEKNAAAAKNITAGGSYAEDISQYAQSAAEQFTLLFSKTDKNSALSAASEDETIQTSSLYQASWIRPQSENSIIDFCVPISLAFAFSRDITAADETDASCTDISQIKASAGFSAFNCFGKAGDLPLFKWYGQDETIHTINTAFSLSDDDLSIESWLVSGVFSSSVYVTKTNTLKNTVSYKFHSSEGWSAKTVFTWKRPTNHSIIERMIDTFLPRFKKLENKTERTSSASVSITADDEDERETAANVSQESETKIGKYFTLKTAAEIGSSFTSEKTELNAALSVSGKASF